MPLWLSLAFYCFYRVSLVGSGSEYITVFRCNYRSLMREGVMSLQQRQLSGLGWLAGGMRFKTGRAVWRWVALMGIAVVLSVAIAGCSGGGSSTGEDRPSGNHRKQVELTLVGYAVSKSAYDGIIPKFQAKWQQEQGQTVSFRQSYGPSGAQTRAVIDGLPADVVHLAIGADVLNLVKKGLVKPDWNQRVPHSGIVGTTVAVIVTRKGNPQAIKTWNDLTRQDVKWVTANPKTSGGAKWNFLALWNAGRQSGKDEAQVQAFVAQAYGNLAVLAKDAREATDAFAKQGQGDALVNYENEVILATARGEPLEYVVPEVNLAIDTPVTVVDQYVDKHGTREVATAFVEFLFTPEAQREFVKAGFRPWGKLAQEKALVNQFPSVKHLSSIQDFGGWNTAQKQFFTDGAIFDQIEASIQK
jgi:sulfate transport system substrate-binding protein